MAKQYEAEHALIELDPTIHLAQLHIADDVIDALEPDRLGHGVFPDLEIRWWPNSVAMVEGVQRLSIRVDGSLHVNAAIAFDLLRLEGRPCTSFDRHLECRLGVGNVESDIVNTGTMLHEMASDLMAEWSAAVNSIRTLPCSSA